MSQFKINPITLIFDDPQLEVEYSNQNYKSFLLQARIAFLIGATLYPIFGVLDSWFVPEENLVTVWAWRLSFLGLGVAIFLINFTSVFKHFYFLAMSIIGFIAATGLIVIYTYLPAETLAYYYPALILVVFWTYNFSGTRFIYALIVDLAVLISYNLLAYQMNHPLSIILAHDIFLFSANIVAGSVGYLTEYNRRKLFFTNQLLQEEKNSHHHARKEAESSNLAKSKFLANMSHELRTPLHAILGFSEIIEINTKEEKTKGSSQKVTAAGNHLLRFINEVLDLSKIESGNIELSIKKYCLNEILSNMLTLINPLAEKHHIQIDNKVSTSFNINVDKIRFNQVLLNVLSNAIKYNSQNGKVIIDSSTDNNFLRLSITDTGNGLTADQQSHLFKEFERFGAEDSHIEGTGLGLVIAKDLIELMGGTITVESEVSKGSRFLIHIPLS